MVNQDSGCASSPQTTQQSEIHATSQDSKLERSIHQLVDAVDQLRAEGHNVRDLFWTTTAPYAVASLFEAAKEEARLIQDGRAGKKIWTEAECLNVLRRFELYCSENTQTPTVATYLEWRRDHPAPLLKTLTQYGTWNALRIRASSDPANVKIFKPVGGGSIWTFAQSVDALRNYLDVCSDSKQPPRFQGYDVWQKDFPGIPPVECVVAQLGGTWNTALRIASAKEGQGLPPNHVRRKHEQWSREEIRSALSEFVNYCIENQIATTQQNYKSWRGGNSSTPGIYTIIRRNSNWHSSINHAIKQKNLPEQ